MASLTLLPILIYLWFPIYFSEFRYDFLLKILNISWLFDLTTIFFIL